MGKRDRLFIIGILVLNLALFITGMIIMQGEFGIKVYTHIKDGRGTEGIQLYYSYGGEFCEQNSVQTWKGARNEYAFLIDMDGINGREIQHLRLDYITKLIKRASFDGLALQFFGITIKQIDMTDDIWNKAVLNSIIYHGKNNISLLQDDPLIIFDDTIVSEIREAYTGCYNIFFVLLGSICSVSFVLEIIFRDKILACVKYILDIKNKSGLVVGGNADKDSKRRWRIVFFLIVFFQCLIMLIYAGKKNTYFIDEIFTYKSIVDIHRQESTNINWYGRYDNVEAENIYTSNDEFMNYITVGEGESIADQSLGSILKSFVTKSTYHVIASLLFSGRRGVMSKWIPIVLNIIIFCVVQYIFYKIIMHLYNNRLMAVFLMGAYGITFGAIETAIYIRHYEFFLLFSMLFTYLMLKMIEKSSVSISEILLSLILVWFGYLNSQYMIIYAGIFGIIFLVTSIIDRQWSKISKFIGCYFVGAAGFLIKNFNWIKNSLSMKNENDQLYMAVNKMFGGDIASIRRMINEYFELLWEYTGSNIIFVVALFIWIAILIKNRKAVYLMENRKTYLILLSACLGYIVCIGWAAPWVAWRYICNIYPIFILLLGAVLFWIECRDTIKYVLMMLCILIGLKNILVNGSSMDTLNRGVYPSLIQNVHECVGEYDIIYMDVEREYRAVALFNSAYMWPSGTDVYITSPKTFRENKANAEKTLNQDTIMVWVDTPATWEIKVKSLMRQCGYKKFVRVYSYRSARSIPDFTIYKCSK